MALKVKCLGCKKVLTPLTIGRLRKIAERIDLPWLAGAPLRPCKCKAIAVRRQGLSIVIWHRVDGPHGPKPFEIVVMRNGQEVPA